MTPIILFFLLSRRAPRYLIRRRSTPGGASAFVASVPGDQLNYTVTGLTADSVGYYHIDAVNHCGVQSTLAATSRLRRIAMDGDNELIEPAPNAPHGVKLTLGAGGQVSASWRHRNDNAEVDAASFNVYVATGATPFDYTVVTHAVALPKNSKALGTFADTTIVRVVVRAVTDGGVEETNTNETTITADASAPTAPASFTVS